MNDARLAPLTTLSTISYREPCRPITGESNTDATSLTASTPFPIPARIPVFPLPNVVLFPKTYLPLHIFEPRYRAMVSDAAMSGQCIGMALLKEGWETDYYGHPPVFSMGCVGRLASVQPLADGRSNILLQGLERFEIEREWYDKAYREATIAVTVRGTETSLDPAVRRRLFTILESYLRSRDDVPDMAGACFGKKSATRLSSIPCPPTWSVRPWKSSFCWRPTVSTNKPAVSVTSSNS